MRDDRNDSTAARKHLPAHEEGLNSHVIQAIIPRKEATSPHARFGQESLGVDVKTAAEAMTSVVAELCSGLSPDEQDTVRYGVEKAMLAAAAQVSRNHGHIVAAPLPVRDLSEEEIEAINLIGKAHPWDDRRSGIKTAVEWVLSYYGPWIPGLLTNHIRQADYKLYRSFIRTVERRGLPDGIDIPSQQENDFRKKYSASATRSSMDVGVNRAKANPLKHVFLG